MRSVPEWIGATDDAAIPPRVKLRIWTRCDGKCALTGRKLQPGDQYDFDHIVPLSLGGKHAEMNLQLVCRDAHKLKTRADVAAKAKADRIRLKHIGAWPRSKARLRGRGFEKTRPAPYGASDEGR